MAEKSEVAMTKTTTFGHNARKANLYMKRSYREASFLERRQKEQSEAHGSMISDLQRQFEEAERKLSEMEKLETNLKQWIQKNLSSV